MKFQRYDEAVKVIARLQRLSPTDPIVKEQVEDIRNDFEGKPILTFTEQVSFFTIECLSLTIMIVSNHVFQPNYLLQVHTRHNTDVLYLSCSSD